MVHWDPLVHWDRLGLGLGLGRSSLLPRLEGMTVFWVIGTVVVVINGNLLLEFNGGQFMQTALLVGQTGAPCLKSLPGIHLDFVLKGWLEAIFMGVG